MKSLIRFANRTTGSVLFAALAIVASVHAQPQAQSAAPRAYDEIFDENQRVRPEYAGIFDIVNALPPERVEAYLHKSYLAFDKDNRLDPMPRIIAKKEFETVISRGVEQRARAIAAFLRDHYSGQKSYRSIVSEDVINRIIDRNGEAGYQGLINPDAIAFPYGPDIIRDAEGLWRVIEDNPGFIGGPGDLRLAQQFLFENLPEIKKLVSANDPEKYYKALAESYHRLAAERGGKAIFLMSPYKTDAEDRRSRQIMKDYGIEAVFPNSGDYELLVRPDGVYVQRRGTKGFGVPEKVGFVALLGEHAWFDPTHPAARERLLIEEAKNIVARPNQGKNIISRQMRRRIAKILAKPRTPERIVWLEEAVRAAVPDNTIGELQKATQSYHGILNAILQGKVGSNFTPGVEFIGDKEFYVHVEKLIRHYLKEEPILRNIDTGGFVGADGKLDPIAVERIFGEFDRNVIKKVDGRGGDAVWVGPKTEAKEVPGVRARVEADPSSYIQQRFTPLSKLRDLIVDMRVISEVRTVAQRAFVTVANVPWGRGLPSDGNGKVNLSDQGREVTILVTDGPSVLMCRDLLRVIK